MPEPMKKGGAPPAENAADANASGLGFAHQKANDGRPDENTANKQHSPTNGAAAGKGSLPGSGLSKADAMELFKSLSGGEKVELLKSVFAQGGAPEPALQKADSEPVTHGELRKLFSDFTSEVKAGFGELRKSLAQNPGAELQKSGLVQLEQGESPPKPELVKMEQEPTYGNRQEEDGSELQKAADMDTPWQIANKDGQLAKGYVPSMAELAKMPLGEDF